MGPLYVQIAETEYLIVESGDATPSEGKTIPLPHQEKVTVFVLDHDEPGDANIRIEVSKGGHLEGQVFYGQLPEFGTVDFSNHGEQLSICHAGQRK